MPKDEGMSFSYESNGSLGTITEKDSKRHDILAILSCLARSCGAVGSERMCRMLIAASNVEAVGRPIERSKVGLNLPSDASWPR